MDKVLVNIDVIHGILSTYRRADQEQSRIFGLILGSKKNNVYHITDAIYGFIFLYEDQQKKTKELVKINDDSLKSILNSLTEKFKLNNPNLPSNKSNKEKETQFNNNDTPMILGGFVTDKEPFNVLFRLKSTLDKVSHENFFNLNEILLMVDPSHKDANQIKYGIKAYEWENKNIRIKGCEKSNYFLLFKEVKTEVVQQLNNIDIISANCSQNLWEKLYKLKIDKNEEKKFSELLADEKAGNDIITKENNNELIKRKIKGALEYLNVFQQILESLDFVGKQVINGDDLNLIALIMSELEPILNDEEIMKVINSDINNKYSVDSLSQLLDIQLALSDKIRELIK